MIPIDELYLDNFSDEVGRLLINLRTAAAGKALELARRELTEAATARGYISFIGHYKRYHVSVLGSSCLYRVPDNKRGHLSAFRGKLVRIAVWHRGVQSDRRLMAGVVDEEQIEMRVKGLYGYLG